MSTRSTARTQLLVTLLLGAFALTGCSTAAKNSTDSQQIAPVIARDLVGVLVQLKPLPVETTVLRLSPDAFVDDDFAYALRQSLEEAGYAIRVSGNVAGTQTVSFSVTQKKQSAAGVVSTYTVNAGKVSVRRSYAASTEGFTQPIGTVQVRGADATTVQHNNRLFESADPEIVGQVAALANDGSQNRQALPATAPTAFSTAPAAQVLPQPNVLARAGFSQPQAQAPTQVRPNVQPAAVQVQPLAVTAAAPLASRAKGQEFDRATYFDSRPMQNVRELGQSNFAIVFEDYSIVDEAVLRFGNDSFRLGQGNKDRMRRLVSQFEPGKDLVSVIGCSHGSTALSVGQKGLALGRAERVKEELLYAGIPEASIFEEGCWAEESFDKRMPRRGVVLTLKRRPS